MNARRTVLLYFLANTLALLGLSGCKKTEASTPESVSEASSSAAPAKKPVTLLNVSYDPTRELYTEYNSLFAKHWKEKTGQELTIKHSQGGAGQQAPAVIHRLEAHRGTPALADD